MTFWVKVFLLPDIQIEQYQLEALLNFLAIRQMKEELFLKKKENIFVVQTQIRQSRKRTANATSPIPENIWHSMLPACTLHLLKSLSLDAFPLHCSVRCPLPTGFPHWHQTYKHTKNMCHDPNLTKPNIQPLVNAHRQQIKTGDWSMCIWICRWVRR